MYYGINEPKYYQKNLNENINSNNIQNNNILNSKKMKIIIIILISIININSKASYQIL